MLEGGCCACLPVHRGPSSLRANAHQKLGRAASPELGSGCDRLGMRPTARDGGIACPISRAASAQQSCCSVVVPSAGAQHTPVS